MCWSDLHHSWPGNRACSYPERLLLAHPSFLQHSPYICQLSSTLPSTHFFTRPIPFLARFFLLLARRGRLEKKAGETERWILWITLTIYSLRLVGEQTGNHGSSVKYLFLSPAVEERKKKAHKSHRRKMPCLPASLFASSAHPFKGHTPRCFFFVKKKKKWTWYGN